MGKKVTYKPTNAVKFAISTVSDQ